MRKAFKLKYRDTWVAQSVERPTPDFGSGHDLTVHEIEPCADSTEAAWDPLSLPFSLPRPRSCTLVLSLKDK